MFLHTLTITLFGLEKHLWDDVPESERRLYASSLLYFLGFVLLASISGITLLYLITGSIYFAIPLGLLVALLTGTIVRFSLIILRKSIFDPENAKEYLTESKTETTLPEVVDNSSITPPDKRSFSMGNIFKKWRGLLSNISINKIPKSDTPIPILTSIIRFILISIIALLITYPLACIFHFDRIKEVNQSKREAYFQQFIKDAQVSLDMKTAYIKSAIDKAENEYNQQNGLLKDKATQLKSLHVQLAAIIQKHNQEFELNFNDFKQDIEGRYFIVHSFRIVSNLPYFFVSLLLMAWVLLAPHIILHRLKTNKKFVYATISTKFYKDKIERKYHENQTYILKILKDKFQYSPPVGFETRVWENPPYCTKKTEHFKVRSKLSKDEFLKSLIKPSI